jgi:hypothetical protein
VSVSIQGDYVRKIERYGRVKAQSDTIILSFLVTAATVKFLGEDARYKVMSSAVIVSVGFLLHCTLSFARCKMFIISGFINLNYIFI